MRPTTLAALVVITLQAHGKNSLTITQPCEEVDFNRKVVAAFRTKLTDAQRRLEELESDGAALTLASCLATDPATATTANLLAALSRTKANRLRASIEASKSTLEKAIETLQARTAQVLAATNYNASPDLKLEHDATTQDVNRIAGGSAKTCDVTATQEPRNRHGCSVDEQKAAEISKDVAELNSLQSYKATPDEAFYLTKLKALLATKGTYGTASTAKTTDGKACSETSGASAQAATNVVTLTGISRQASWQTTTVNTMKAPEMVTNCEDDSEANTKAFISLKAAAYAICSGRQATIALPSRVATEQIKNLQEDTDVQELATLITTGPSAADPGAEAKNKAVQQLLGDETQTVHEKYLKNLQDRQLEFKIGGKDVKGGVVTLSNHADYSKAVGFCLGLKYRTAKMQKKEASPISATAKTTKECKGETDKDKCNEKNGCEFKDGECKAKEGLKATETDGKTNTTKSNSLLINKAPLWLAFLLI
uniref:Variant surface glycoprotein 613 n=1 Tax=Trypanosoma brucei TaxID=5691 RepID=M4T0G5_9TRYP|nr:variant surface glycoprotein 613 [Trypanosoma brucei]